MLPCRFAIMPNEELPSEFIVLRGERMKCRHSIFVGFFRPARFQHQDPIAGLGQIRRDRAAARTGAHDDEIVFVVHAVREHGVAPSRFRES
jgi:hypothetical protein